MKTLFKTTLCLALLIGLNGHATESIDHQVNSIFHLESDDKPKKQFIKVALLLDTSNSMDGLIDQAKAQLWEIVNELSYARCGHDRPSLQIALYEYGNDHLSAKEGYIRQVLQFSQDLDEISKELFSLTTKGGNEFCGQVIQTSLDQLNWGNNDDDLKLIFIAGNEPFTQGRVHYKDAAVNANEKGVTINTIYCGDFRTGIATSWKDGADLTYGDYIAINHNRATVHIATPYDDQILQYNQKLNSTYIAYGTAGQAKSRLQSTQDENAKSYSNANAVSRTVSKSSHLYKNSSWDLVDAIELEEVVVEEIEDDALPKELKGKSNAQKKEFIEKKRKQRAEIQNRIKDLNAKRKEFIANTQKDKKENGLENAMLNAIKTQAKKKNYEW